MSTTEDALALIGEYELAFSREDYEALKRAAALLQLDVGGRIRIDLTPSGGQASGRAKLERQRRTDQLQERHERIRLARQSSTGSETSTDLDSNADRLAVELEEPRAPNACMLCDSDDDTRDVENSPPPHLRSKVCGDDDLSPVVDDDEEIPVVTDDSVTLSPLHQGRCGAYLVTVHGGVPIGVFKPADEELPPGRLTHWRRGVKVGAAMRKEVAAFKLDHDGFCRVPQTLFLRMPVPQRDVPPPVPCLQKLGSFQVFVPHICAAEDIGSARLCTEEVHKLAALDVRLLNLDRHLGNALVVDGASADNHELAGAVSTSANTATPLGLVPIDHGLCLPSVRECADVWFEWTHFAQCRMPFGALVAGYIMQLDPWADLELLLGLGLPLSNALTVVFSTRLLQAAVLRGWRIDRLGVLCMRSFSDLSKPSVLEQWIDAAFSTCGVALHHVDLRRLYVDEQPLLREIVQYFFLQCLMSEVVEQ